MPGPHPVSPALKGAPRRWAGLGDLAAAVAADAMCWQRLATKLEQLGGSPGMPPRLRAALRKHTRRQHASALATLAAAQAAMNEGVGGARWYCR